MSAGRGDALVVGLGQWAAGDDSVGLVVARRISARGADAIESADASVLVDLLAGGRRVVVVDAVVTAGIAGKVLHLLPNDVESGLVPLSSHGIGVADALVLASTLHGEDVLRRVDIVGVTVDAVPRVGSKMSPRVRAAVSRAAALATSLLRRRS